jgi:hypothetical protein
MADIAEEEYYRKYYATQQREAACKRSYFENTVEGNICNEKYFAS